MRHSRNFVFIPVLSQLYAFSFSEMGGQELKRGTIGPLKCLRALQGDYH